MTLQLGNPALLAALGLVLLPILAHLTGARRLVRVPFPPVRFLAVAHRTLRRRWLLDDVVLMALRALAVAALVMVFCRPSLLRPVKVAHGSNPDLDTVVVVDRSLSTQLELDGASVFSRIQAEGVDVLEGLAPGTRAALVMMDQAPEVVGRGLTTPRAELVARLRRLEPGHGSTDLGAALHLAAEVLATGGAASGQVIVLGDGTATRTDGLEELPAGIEFVYRDLRVGRAVNRFPLSVDVGDGRQEVPVEVSVAASDGADTDRVAADLVVEAMEPVRATVAQGEPARFTVVDPRPGITPAQIVVGADALPADDSLPFFLHSDGTPSVVLVGRESNASPLQDELYYLTRALETAARPRAVGVEELSELPAASGTALVLANVPCNPDVGAEVRRLVEGGAGVLISVGDLTDRDVCNEVLAGMLPAQLGSVKSREAGAFEEARVGLAMPDTDRALWAPFGEGGLRTFGRVRFSRVMEVEPHLAPRSRVLLRYTDGRAALLERQVGDGRLLLFTSTLDDDWTDLPIRAIYLPMMLQLVGHLSGGADAAPVAVHRVGDRPRLGPLPGELILRHPDGTEEPLAGGDDVQIPPLGTPGHHTVLRTLEGGGSEVVARVAVTTDPRESSLEPMDRLAFAETGLVYVEQDEGGGESRATVMRPTSLVPALALVVLLALCGEAVLGRRR